MKRLDFYANRSTPRARDDGEKMTTRKGYGPLVRTRPATPAEEQKLAKGGWVRVDAKDRKPSSTDYKLTGYRPSLAEKRKAAIEAKQVQKIDHAVNIRRVKEK